MNSLICFLLSILTLIWIGVPIWILITKNTSHWLFRVFLWINFLCVSFIPYIILFLPISIPFGGFIIIPFMIWNGLKILRFLGCSQLTFYTVYVIISTILVGILSIKTNNDRLDQSPTTIVVWGGFFFWIMQLVLIYCLPKTIPPKQNNSSQAKQSVENLFFQNCFSHKTTSLKNRFILLILIGIFTLILLSIFR